MRKGPARALRALVGLLGVLAVAPAAHATSCNHVGGGNGTTTLAFAPADGTVTLAAAATGGLTFAVGAGAPVACSGGGSVANTQQLNAVGSTAADTLVLDFTGGLLVRADGTLTAIDASLGAGSDVLDVRLPSDDNVVLAGTLGADFDGDAAPDLTWSATEGLAFSGNTGADDLELGGDRAGLGDPVDVPATLSGGAGDDTLRGGAAADMFAGGPGEDVVTYDDRTSGLSASLDGQANDGLPGEGDRIGLDVEDLTGGAGNDALAGDLRDNVIDGGPGNDAVTGGRGDDTLTGNTGDDKVAGGDGDDTLDESAPANGSDSLSGGDGSDTVDYSGRTAAVTIVFDGKADNGEAGETDTVAGDIEGASGGAGNDTIAGTSADDTIDGGAGADAIGGGAGADTLTGGPGNDIVDGGPGDDTLDPGAGDDVARGGAGADEIDTPGAPSGLDDIADGSDVLDGGEGNLDTISYAGRTLPVTVTFDGARNDGQAGENDQVTAFETMVGGRANDVLAGGPGDDTITPGPGDDLVSGGAGEDAVSYSDHTQPVTVALGAPGSGGAAGEHDAIAADIEDATGGDGNDSVTGDASDNYLVGGPGNDTVTGGAGDDDLDGGDGSDALDGGTGEDTADFSFHSYGVVANLATQSAASFDASGAAATDRLAGFEDLLGSDHDDTLTGDGEANTIDGGILDDTIAGGAGDDTLKGGAGDDTLTGEAGADTVEGGDGEDTMSGAAGPDELNGGADDDTLTGGAGADRLAGASGDDTLAAGAGDDTLLGGSGDDGESGGAGRDRFDQGQAADGADSLDGGSGNDTVDYRGRHAKLTVTIGLRANDGEHDEGDNVRKTVEVVFGGSGADRLSAGLKAAVLHGGNGADVLAGGKAEDYLDGGGGADIARRVGRGDRVVSCTRA
jgi:Ca2+-binding RTX toxin-like protein